jgi:hypothetical protein
VPAVPSPPPENALYREDGTPEVYWIRGGQRIHLPSPYTLDALSRSWNEVQVVPPGSLSPIPIDDSWEGIGTPSSVVQVPATFGSGQVYWPIRNIPTSKRHVAWGMEVWTVELRGWVMPGGGSNSDDPDWSYELLLDSGWALSQGIDLNAVIRVGNILQAGIPEAGVNDPRAWCATPIVHLELTGWPPKDQADKRRRPDDWQFSDKNLPYTGVRAAEFPQAIWPFDPRAPARTNVPIHENQYVRVYGALVTDVPHADDSGNRKPAVCMWWTDGQNREGNQARWTEVHPVDWMSVEPPKNLYETFRGVTVVAPGTYQWQPQPTSTLDVEIPAPPKPGGNQALRVQEFVGPETTPRSIVDGNSSRTGAKLTLLADRLQLHVTVGGRKSWSGGSPGKFKALYRLFWETVAAGPTELWRSQWTTGWTSVAALLVSGQPHLLSYKNGSGEVAIDRLRSDLQGVDGVWTSSWSTGWTTFTPLDLGDGRTYYLAYKLTTGQVAIDEVRSNGAGVDTRFGGTWATGWTNVVAWRAPSSSDNRTLYLAYKQASGGVAIDAVKAGAAGIDPIWQGQWSTGWTTLMPYLVGGERRLLAYKAATGEVSMDKVNPYGAGGTQTFWTSTWSTGWSIFVPFELGGQPHYLAYKGSTGEVAIDRLLDSGGVTSVWTGTWSAGWTSMVPFNVGGVWHLLSYKSGAGDVAIDRLS